MIIRHNIETIPTQSSTDASMMIRKLISDPLLSTPDFPVAHLIREAKQLRITR